MFGGFLWKVSISQVFNHSFVMLKELEFSDEAGLLSQVEPEAAKGRITSGKSLQ